LTAPSTPTTTFFFIDFFQLILSQFSHSFLKRQVDYVLSLMYWWKFKKIVCKKIIRGNDSFQFPSIHQTKHIFRISSTKRYVFKKRVRKLMQDKLKKIRNQFIFRLIFFCEWRYFSGVYLPNRTFPEQTRHIFR
jgi:hypothetical protein